MLDSEHNQFIADFIQIVERNVAAAAEIDDPFSETIVYRAPHFWHVLERRNRVSDCGDGSQCSGWIFLSEKLIEANQVLAGSLGVDDTRHRLMQSLGVDFGRLGLRIGLQRIDPLAELFMRDVKPCGRKVLA